MTEEANQDSEDQKRPRTLWHSRWVRLALIWGTWTFIGLVFTLQGYFTS
jgi:hypothetical protein